MLKEKQLPRCIVLLALFLFSASAASSIQNRIRSLVKSGTVILHDESGQTIISINPDKLYVPASIIKVLTSQMALATLGEDYRFVTEFYTNTNGHMAVMGYGDPFLVSDEIRLIAKGLKKRGIRTIGKLYLDHSQFAQDLTIPGVSKTNNPYDALNGALVVNFNTINVSKDKNGKVLPGEPETPLTPLAVKKAGAIRAGTKQRVNLSANRHDCHQYAGELLYAIFEEQGIEVADESIGNTTVDQNWDLVYTHRNSRALPGVLQGLLKYSNNFIANQIFLTIGAKGNPPATLAKGQAFAEDYIRNKLEMPASELMVIEGSGISRNIKVTGDIMIRIMEWFKPHADLLTPRKGHPVKSGTLRGVSNYAGYIKTAKGYRPFVIMLNQAQNHRDTIMDLLAQYQGE